VGRDITESAGRGLFATSRRSMRRKHPGQMSQLASNRGSGTARMPSFTKGLYYMAGVAVRTIPGAQ